MTVDLERGYPTPFSNSALLPLLLLSLTKQRHTPDGSTRIKREYDYVIVGGGTAGSVVASRLSEKPCVSVLLLEAGGEPPLLTDIPALSSHFWFTKVDWKYRTAPQKHTGKQLMNRQIVWPSGKMLGGSSSINDMLAVRGNRKDYDNWEKQGAKGWSYKDVFPFFLKLENNKDYEFLSNGYHGRGGPVTVHKPRYESELKRAVYEAATGLGYKIVDPSSSSQTGFYDHQATLRSNQRCSTAKAYLVPVENRTNVDILPHARVTKILIKNRQAKGVRFHFRGYAYNVKARKEVIVSAGTVNTAQLLMLSGIGPKTDLRRLNIPIVADLPVGQNFHDHGATKVPYLLDSYVPDFEEKISDPDSIHQYTYNRTGPLASTNGISYVAFLKGQSIHAYDDSPNYQLLFSEMPTTIAKHHFGLKPEVYQKLYKPYEHQPLFVCTVSQLQPKSRGEVTLRSKNPYDSPIIDPNYLADPRDVEDLVQGMRTCQKIAASRPLQKLGVRPLGTSIPGCERHSYDEDEYFRCHARSILFTMHDAVGTAKMGDPWDPTTVVDPKLRVKNIKSLRVVDASIMPTVPSGNINIPTIMVAEKASDIIKENIDCYKSWKKPEEPMGWSEDEEVWEDKEYWDKPEDKETIWVEDEEKWEKPEDKETIWVEDEEKWEKPKDKETIWVEDEEKWEKPKDKETIWVEDEEEWEKPKDKETAWVKEDWEEPSDKETTWVVQNKDQWEKPKETTWVKDKYKEISKQEWNTPDKESWSNEETKPLKKYLKHPIQDSWSETKDDYTANYEDKQKNLFVKQYERPMPSKWGHEKTESNAHWEEPDDYESTKKIEDLAQLADWEKDEKETSSPWKESNEYKVTKSVKELVKLAEKDSKKTKISNPWKEADDYDMKTNVEELVKLAKEEDEKPKWTPSQDNPYQYKDSKSLEELVKLADIPSTTSQTENINSKTRWY